VRRSGATNVAPAHLQAEFIDAARVAMGQPGEQEVRSYIGKFIKIVFNGDRETVTGKLTSIVHHPTSIRLVLDNDAKVTYSLNSIQSILCEILPAEIDEHSS
jgi:hypothetical protein